MRVGCSRSLRRIFFLLAAVGSGIGDPLLVPPARADLPPIVSSTDSRRVVVSGIPDRFEQARAAVERAKAQSGRDYRVIVVGGDAGRGGQSARNILDAVIERWRSETPTTDPAKAGFDPAGDVTIVLDVKGRTIAMRAPWALEVSSGLDPTTIEEELIGKVFVPLAKDEQYDAGVAALVDATERWVKNRQDREQARVEAARVFRTRTLPLGLLGLAGFGGLTFFFLQRSRHDRRLHEARSKLAAFKTEVVALTDLLDSQQERHRLLPHSDPDFKTPTQGQTRTTYDNVQSSIRRYRERWLSLMDVWEKAQEKIDSETFLGTAAADEAIRLLDSAEARPPLADVAGECRAPLDVLEQAHENSRRLAEELDAAVAATGGRLGKIAARGRSAAGFQAGIADATRGLALARTEVESDPIDARGRLEQAKTALDGTVARIESFEAVDDRRQKVSVAADDAEKKIQAKRAEGWLLAEPGAEPLELVVGARKHVATAAQLLDSGEIEGALRHVERAERDVAEALAMLESIVAAKARIDDLLPGCITRLEAVASRRGQIVQTLEQLAGSYAESSWADIADNVAKADEGMARIKAMVSEAQAAAAPSRQHYFKALALLEEAVRQEEWVEGCQAAVTDRRQELDGLRASLPQRSEKVMRRVSVLGQRLERQRTDRVRANEHCREAGRLADIAEKSLRIERPDLLQSARVLDAADASAARAEELADEDERLARQAFGEIEEADALVRRAAAWYAEGVSADVRGALSALEQSKGLLSRQRYEDSIRASSEATRLAREAYAAATAEAERRRQRRIAEVQRRQMEDAFTRMSRGAGPWVISLPGGVFTGPDPWRSLSGSGGSMRLPTPSAGGSWGNRTAEGRW